MLAAPEPHRAMLRRAIVVVCLSALSLATSVSAHSPTAGGGSRGSFSSDQLVTYKFAGSYPSFMTGAVTSEFEIYYHDATTHNSLAPRLDDSSSGTATVYYSTVSPCGTGNPDWLGCVPSGGSASFKLYVRPLPAPEHTNWGWYEKDSSCSGPTPRE